MIMHLASKMHLERRQYRSPVHLNQTRHTTIFLVNFLSTAKCAPSFRQAFGLDLVSNWRGPAAMNAKHALDEHSTANVACSNTGLITR